MPKDTHTPSRNFRIPAEEFNAAKAEAKARGETLTDAVRRLLREYTQERRPSG